MAAPVGNRFGKGHGRPRSIDREIERLRAAAGHIDALIEQHYIAELLVGHEPEVPHDLVREGEALRAELADVERIVERIAAIVEGDWSAPRREGRRKRRALGADPYDQAILQAGRALDRLLPFGPKQ